MVGKKNVSIVAKFFESGEVTPLTILWDDGRKFDIDRVTDVRKAASLKAGGIGIRFTCIIRDRQIFLFKDEDQWFMETRD